MTAAIAIDAQSAANDHRTIIAIGLLVTALIASLAILALISATAVDVMQVSSVSDSMVVDARQAIFRAG